MTLTKEYLLTLLKKLCLAAANIALFSPILQLFVQLNDFYFSRPLLIYFIFVQLIFIFLPKWYLWLPIQLISSLYLIYTYFPLQQSFSQIWFQLFLNEFLQPFAQMISGEITILPNILSLLLIISLLLVISFALLKIFNPYPAFFTGLGYLLILQAFTTTDLFDTVISTLLFGFLLIGVARIKATGSWRNSFFSLLLLTVGGILFTRVSLWGVKNLTQQQEWTISQADVYHESLEEKGFYEWIDRYSPGGVSSRSGFSENDSNLGGPLTQRHNTVFIAHTSQPHYWLIESKEIYTGKGWETSRQDYVPVDLSMYELFDAEQSNIEIQEIDIELSESFSYIPHTYGTLFFDFGEQTENIDLLIEIPTQQYILEDAEDLVDAYTLIVSPREFDPDISEATSMNENLGDIFYDTYTQLPNELPERVIELAYSITEGATTPYEQVRAIEQYLKEDGGFRYSVSEAAYIPEGRDYVDHFLFDTKVGYCDNYSTAMVVLCRALGIPTRWAKGFNSGEEITDEEETYYEVSNANAHSWPEIYFTDYGWVPFEPTPPFDQPLTDETALEEDFDDTIAPEEEQQDEAVEPSENSTESSQDATSESATQEDESSTAIANESWFSQHTSKLMIFVILVVVALTGILKRWSILIWLVKKLLLTHLLTLQQQLNLVMRLFKTKWKLRPNQTMRQYFEQLILLVPRKEPAILAFIQLLEEVNYAPPIEIKAASSQQSEVLIEMLSVFEELQQNLTSQSL
ncbi:transglutaminase domain-containing protein [Desemzia sp. RIT804]|uniref:transglutaminase-like domain-containing protein n=1 Tax=Desemzia sp. RIT 804 TaxID=2810209 RepID=UPI0019515415|nr:transglutaminase-like domain-containing protein [Desemzia sp. RIT 804]MBM6615767.1 transglutaminase domain-containing protein [Desemzia sp. RIT 804]